MGNGLQGKHSLHGKKWKRAFIYLKEVLSTVTAVLWTAFKTSMFQSKLWPLRGHEDKTDTVHLSAGQYSRSNKLQRRYNTFVLDTYQEAFREELRASHQILDIGCGTGDFTRDGLLPRCLPCRRIVGVDSSPEMVEYAGNYSAVGKLDFRVLDICADVTNLLDEFGHFDRVYSFYCLHWADDLGVALKNVAKLLTTEGECLLVFYASHESVPAWRALARMERWKNYKEPLLKYTPKTQDMDREKQRHYISLLLADAGLSAHVLEILRSATYDGCSQEEILETQMGVLPIAQLVPQEQRAQLLADVTENVRRVHAPDADKECYRMYIVMASRTQD